jgi:hypothetical protein
MGNFGWQLVMRASFQIVLARKDSHRLENMLVPGEPAGVQNVAFRPA